MAQTFCDYANAVLPSPNHSRSLRPMIEGSEFGRDFALCEWAVRASRCGVDLKLRTVRARRYKLTLEVISGAGELYYLNDDPFELDNRFDDSALAAVRRELTEMIASRPQDQIVNRSRRLDWREGRRRLFLFRCNSQSACAKSRSSHRGSLYIRP